MMLISMYTNSGVLNTMVPSKMGWRVAGGVLLVFLGCWNWGPYVGPNQQGDTVLILTAWPVPVSIVF
jgi:hypothetical protein